MSNYAYVAIGLDGQETRGTLDVSDQSEALRRIKQMGLYPTRVLATPSPGWRRASAAGRQAGSRKRLALGWLPLRGGGIKPAKLAVFTRQVATLVEAGLPLLRGLRILEEQEEHPSLRRIIGDLSASIENGSSFAEALASHPRVFDSLYVNMVRAGEISGALEVTLRRLTEFIEKAQRIKGRIKSALYYPCAVLLLAIGILTALMVFIVPRFKGVLSDLMGTSSLPKFTQFVFGISDLLAHHFLALVASVASAFALSWLASQTQWGRRVRDHLKLNLPVFGPLFTKAAVSRFSRTLSTLVGNGVPILQALNIVKETSGNCIVGAVVARLHDNVKVGDSLAPTLKSSGVFPKMVGSMVEVGEQTGALPDMLARIADGYDEEVDNAANALTSLLEPVMIVILAVIVGSIVIAMFMPLIAAIGGMSVDQGDR